MQIYNLADQAARLLSAGQRKRCALTRLLFQPEALWLLDEPYANLDADGLSLVDGLLREHKARAMGDSQLQPRIHQLASFPERVPRTRKRESHHPEQR